VENFSGGNKRKLSTALALIGNLSLIFLDECSSGMDPKAKRQLWSIITKTRNAGKAVILTSHSMQECEALCTKLAIMVDGTFSCLGSIQHLKNKFSKGFVLTIKMAKRDDQDHLNLVLNKVKEAFPFSELKEVLLDLLTFHINTTELKWSKVFEELAKIKQEVGISDYTMTQSSLESVFLFFSKQGKRVVE
jgi:ATP-binding cassette subfamily A (ABC1) protein 3